MPFTFLRRILGRIASRKDHNLSRRQAAVARNRRVFFESLEERRVLATFAEFGTGLNLDLNVASQSVSVFSAGTSYSLTLNSGVWNGIDSANATGNGTNVLTVTTAGLAVLSTINITDSAAGTGVSFVNSGINAYSDDFNVTLDSGPTSAVQFTGSTSFTLASGISVNTARNISFGNASSLTTADGNIMLQANQGVAPTSGNFVGINVNNATIQATGTGFVTVLGKGGDDSAGSQFGLRVQAGGQIRGGTSGLSVQGAGGNSTGNLNYGLLVTGTNSTITSIGGDVSAAGTGGGLSGSSTNYGVFVDTGGRVTAGASGTVSVMGQGGNSVGTGSNNYGVRVAGNNATQILSSGGAITVSGTGGGGQSSTLNVGVSIGSSGQITGGGNGTVTVTGQGGNTSGTGGSNYGVSVEAGASLTSGSGAVTVSGTGGGNRSSLNKGVQVVTGGQITAGGGGAVTVTGQGGITAAGSDGAQNYGVEVQGTNARITSSGGAVTVTATGGGGGGGIENHGILVRSTGQITAGGTGPVTISGNAGNTSGNGGTNHGVFLSFAGNIASNGGDVSVTGMGGGGGGTSGNHGVSLADGSRVTASGSGTVNVAGWGGKSTGSAANNFGVYLTGASSQIDSAAGAVTVTGTGGGLSGSVSNSNRGVFLELGGQIAAGGAGTVSVYGQGGQQGTESGTIGSSNHGVHLISANSRIFSGGGAVLVQGTGGGAATGTANRGVVVENAAQITAGASGAVTVAGYGGNPTGSGGTNYGVLVSGTGAQITSSGGPTAVSGLGGGAGSSANNYGVQVASGGVISVGGSGALDVVGTGGSTTGGSNYGVVVTVAGSQIMSGSGGVNITGTAGSGSGSFGVHLVASGAVIATGGGNISLTADSVNIDSTASVNGGAGSVNLRQKTAGLSINLGGGDVTGSTLGLTDAELDRVTAETLQIGDLTSGAIAISAVISPLTYSTLEIQRGVAFSAAGGFASEVTSATVFEKIRADGPVSIHTSASLTVTAVGGFVPTPADAFSILTNTAAGTPTGGNFSGKPEGTLVSIGGVNKPITYIGGTGNDVVIGVVNRAPTDIALVGSSVGENSPNGRTVGALTGSDPDAGDSLTFALLVDADGRFSVVGNELRVAGALDFETAASHRITIRATDNGGLFFDEEFTIDVSNLNEAPTGIVISQANTPENATGGTSVGILSVTDSDAGDSATFSLVAGAGSEGNAAFYIADAVLHIAAAFDYETQSSYSIRVRATDSGGLTHDEVIAIDVTDSNEAPTNITLAGDSVAENSAVGTVVGTLSGADPDAGDSLAFLLQDDAGGRFSIVGNELRVAGPLDYEAVASHDVTVRARDNGGLFIDRTFTTTVTDVVEPPRVSITGVDQSISEAVGVIAITAVLDRPLAEDVEVAYAVAAGGMATSGVDFQPLSTVFAFAAGQTSASISVEIMNDNADEFDESFIVELAPAGSIVRGNRFNHSVTIQDDDDLPQVSFFTPSQIKNEGESGVIEVRLSAISSMEVTVPLLFSGSATNPSDYSVGSSSITIPAGRLTASTSLTVADDTAAEPTEQVSIYLGTPTNATLSSLSRNPLQQIVTIPRNDIPYASFTTSYQTKSEAAGTVSAVVRLSNPSSSEVVVPFRVLSGAGHASNADRTIITSSPLRFLPGEREKSIQIAIVNDELAEPGGNEWVQIELFAPSGANLGGAIHVLSIQDEGLPLVNFAPLKNAAGQANGVIWEDDGQATVTVEMSKPSVHDTRVRLRTSGVAAAKGFATLKTDFGVLGMSPEGFMDVSIPAGQTSKTITVLLTDDSKNEPSEKINFSLDAPSGYSGYGRIGSVSSQELVIRDDDPLVSINATDYSITEGNTKVNFTLNLSAPTNEDITIPYSFGKMRSAVLVPYGTATPSDFRGSNSSVVIGKGLKSASASFDIVEDTIDEPTETVIVKMGTPSGDAIGNGSPVTFEILDDDAAPTVTFKTSNSSISEANKSKTVTVELPRVSGKDIYVTLEFTGAKRNTDYTVSGLDSADRLKIPAGAASASFTLKTKDNTSYQGSRDVVVTMKKATNANLPSSTANRKRIFTITDNESKPVPKPAPEEVVWGAGTVALEIPEAGDLYNLSNTLLSDQSGSGNDSDVILGSGFLAIATSGLLDGATVYFDANFNGVADFLDLDNDGTQDEDEPTEPVMATEFDGSFLVTIDPEFDRNADGVISSDEGRLATVGGVDSSTGLAWQYPLTAPMGFFAISPLSTLVERLATVHGQSVEDAGARVTEALGIEGLSLPRLNFLRSMAAVDGAAAAAYAELIKVSDTVLAVAELFAGVPDAPPLAFFADLIYGAIAERIVEPEASLDLSLQPLVADLIAGISAASGVALSSDPAIHAAIVEGAGQVIAAGNLAVDALPFSGDLDYAAALVRVKQVMQGQASMALRAVTAGEASLASVVGDFTGANLDTKIAAALVASLVPPAVGVLHTALTEGNDGQRMMEFTVQLVGEHAQPVSVDFTTRDDAASADGGDYQLTTGTLHWSGGDNSERKILVPILGDEDFESDESLAVLLTAASGAVIYLPQAYGYILNDDVLTHTTASGTPTELVLQLDSQSFGLLENGQTIGEGYSTEPLAASLFGQDDADDALTIDLTAGSFRSDTLTYQGGDGGGVDTATIRGGQYDTIRQTFFNATDGTTRLDPSDSDASLTFHWFGLEPFLVNVGDVSTMIFELPNGVTQAILEDADPTDADPGLAGKLRLRSPVGAFEATTFTSPSVVLAIRGLSLPVIDVLSLDPSFSGELRIESAAPLVVDQAIATDEDFEVNILLAASDAQGDALTFEFVDLPDHGALSGTAPNVIYTPAANYAGNDSFSYRVYDGLHYSGLAVVSIEVIPVNDPPIAAGGSQTTDEDTPFNVLWSVTDVDSGPLTFLIVSAPAHGTLSADFVYTPHHNYAGDDRFSFRARDGFLDSNLAVVSITIRPVNDPPTAANRSFVAGEDMPRTLSRESLVGATDIDSPGADLAVMIDSQPTHGTVIVDPLSGDLVYTPQPSYVGLDSFKYRISDGQLTSASATIELDVKPAPRIVDVLARFGAGLSKSYSLLNNARILPWVNIAALDVVFSEDVAIDGDDVRLEGVVTNQYGGAVSYSSATRTARLTLAAPLARDRLTLKLDGDGAADGNPGIVSAVDAILLKGGDFFKGFNVLAADANGDGVVSILDSTHVRNSSPGYGIYNLFCDLDGDGDVDINDMNEPRKRVNWRLP